MAYSGGVWSVVTEEQVGQANSQRRLESHTHTSCREAGSQPLRHWSIWWTSGAAALCRDQAGIDGGMQTWLEDDRSWRR